MKFRTQLIISMVFFGLALAIISASVISTNQQVERLNKQEELAKNIEFKVGELSYLSNDYLLYHESQQIDRWESKFSSISEDVSNLTVDRPEQQVHANNIKSSQQQLKEIFGDIVSKIKSSSSLQQNTVDSSFIQVSSSRLGVQTQGIIFDVSRLSQMLRDQADQTQQRSTTLVFFLVGAFIALLLANYLLFYRGTLRSIEFLQTGTKIIGSGNLDFSLEEKRNDEIGELSKSFNLMTANLKAITASKLDLEREIDERKRAEEEQARLASFPKLNPNPIVEIDKGGKVLFLNPAAQQLFPDLQESGCNHPWLADWETVVRTFSEIDTRMYTRDISVGRKWYQQAMYPVSGTQLIRTYGLDITERKRAEERLAYQANLLTNTTDVIYSTDEQLRLTSWNHAAEKVYGWKEEDVLGRNVVEVTGSMFDPEVRSRLTNVLVETGDVTTEIEHTTKSGKRVIFESKTVLIHDTRGKIVGFVAVNRDITERKRAEEALRKSEAKLRAVFRSLSEGIVLLNTKGDVEEVNDAVPRTHGHTLEELGDPKLDPRWKIIRPDGTLFPVDEQPAIVALRTGQAVQDIEMGVPTSDGKLRWRLVNAQPVYDDSKNLLGAVASFFDITELKRAEEELRKSREELEQRVLERTAELSDAKENLEAINEELQVEISEHEETEKDLLKAKEAAEAAVEAKAAFLANMSHELRTPMNAVIGFSSLLLDESLTPDQKDYIERIRVGGEALLGLINDVLDFSKMEKNKMELDCHPLSLRALVDESMDMVIVQANNKGLNLAFTINYGTQDTIIGDHGRLRQILVNLLNNAVKFTEDGDVSLSVSSKAVDGNVRKISFAVEDSGIGIPQEKMKEIFEPFTQVEHTLSRKRDGVGLGLAIAKNLVELMGGTIWAESTQGKGTTFSFTIEAEMIPGKQLDFGRMDGGIISARLPGLKPMRILVAEDNPSNQKVLVEMLKRLGYRPDAVADGREVVQSLERQHYDLVLMDIKMPEMDGITATQVIRKLRPVNGPKIVAITAFALEGDREKCLEAGMDDYIAKPVQMRELAEVLKKNQPSSVY